MSTPATTPGMPAAVDLLGAWIDVGAAIGRYEDAADARDVDAMRLTLAEAVAACAILSSRVRVAHAPLPRCVTASVASTCRCGHHMQQHVLSGRMPCAASGCECKGLRVAAPAGGGC